MSFPVYCFLFFFFLLYLELVHQFCLLDAVTEFICNAAVWCLILAQLLPGGVPLSSSNHSIISIVKLYDDKSYQLAHCLKNEFGLWYTDEGSTPKGFLWLLSIRPKVTTVFTIHLNCVLGGTTRLIWCKSIAQNVKLCSLTGAHKKALLMSKICGSLKAKLLHVAVKATATFSRGSKQRWIGVIALLFVFCRS